MISFVPQPFSLDSLLHLQLNLTEPWGFGLEHLRYQAMGQVPFFFHLNRIAYYLDLNVEG